MKTTYLIEINLTSLCAIITAALMLAYNWLNSKINSAYMAYLSCLTLSLNYPLSTAQLNSRYNRYSNSWFSNNLLLHKLNKTIRLRFRAYYYNSNSNSSSNKLWFFNRLTTWSSIHLINPTCNLTLLNLILLATSITNILLLQQIKLTLWFLYTTLILMLLYLNQLSKTKLPSQISLLTKNN